MNNWLFWKHLKFAIFGNFRIFLAPSKKNKFSPQKKVGNFSTSKCSEKDALQKNEKSSDWRTAF